MKTMQEPKIMHARGFTITELVVVIAIIAIMAAIVGISSKSWIDKYKVESEIRTMHADLIQTRAQAMEKNRQHVVTVNAGSYRVYEYNEDATTIDPGDDTWQTPKTLTYQALATGWTGTLIIDTRGIISTDTASSLVGSLSIQFDTRSSGSLYDCLEVLATRINVGRMNGTTCAPQ